METTDVESWKRRRIGDVKIQQCRSWFTGTIGIDRAMPHQGRIISIHDKIDTDNKLFPDTTPAEVLAMFGALPEEVAVLRKSSDKIIRLQQSISIPISKKSMSKTERDKKIVDMYNNGYSIRDIWKESGVQSKSTVYSILNKYKVQLNRTPGRVPGIRK